MDSYSSSAISSISGLIMASILFFLFLLFMTSIRCQVNPAAVKDEQRATTDAMQPLEKNSSILIIGAGTWGTSIAYRLVKRGYTNIKVLDSNAFPSSISAGNDHNKILEEREWRGAGRVNTLRSANHKAQRHRPPPRTRRTWTTPGTPSRPSRPRSGATTRSTPRTTTPRASSTPPSATRPGRRSRRRPRRGPTSTPRSRTPRPSGRPCPTAS